MGSDTQLPTIGSDRNITATAEGTMQAMLQDTYGSADVLRLARIASPEIGESEQHCSVIVDAVGNASHTPSPPIGSPLKGTDQ